MIFLKFQLFKPETWLSEVSGGIMGTIISGLRTLLFNVTSIIYGLLVNVYNLFDKLCNARILDNDIIAVMSQRIGVLLGLIMFFYIIFAFIQMIINPEKIVDKEKGAIQIVKKVMMVIFMLAISTMFFEMMFGLQKKIIDSNIIGRLLIPYDIQGIKETDEDGNKIDKFGNLLSANLFQAFYRINPTIENENTTLSDGNSNSYDDCNLYLELFLDDIFKYNRYEVGNICLNSYVDVNRKKEDGSIVADQVFVIDFNGFLAPLAGGFAVYLILMYCFKVGVRMIQLAFLEIISPMAIIGHLAPKKDTMFTKWWKIYFSTYIDVFIRIAIINLIIFLICTIYSTDTASGNLIFWESLKEVGLKSSDEWFFSVVIVLALLTFAKKAPDLIKEIIGSSASKLGFVPAIKDIVGLEKTWKGATGVLGGALGGATVGLLGGGLGGFAGGLLKGSLSGLKGQGFAKTAASAWKARSKTNAEMAKVRANGGNWFGYNLAKMQHGLGLTTAAEYDEQRIADLEAEANLYNTASKEAESEAIKNGANYNMLSFDGSIRNLTALEKLSNDQTISSNDRAKYQAEYNKLLKSSTMFNLDYGLVVENGEIFFDNSGDFNSLRDSSGTIHTSYTSIESITDKDNMIGKSNTTIEANMSKLAGEAVNGRGNRGKTIRNNNNSAVTRIKVSETYKRNKANNSK